jgi:hypothetical protein
MVYELGCLKTGDFGSQQLRQLGGIDRQPPRFYGGHLRGTSLARNDIQLPCAQIPAK